jgi:ParB-like chromosome segregation protein Spo0J
MNPEVVWLKVDDLRCGPSPRQERLDRAHVAALVELEGRWPPILVSPHDGRVIDGHHRVAAARLIGQTDVAASLFYGTADEAFVESVRRNVEHGLPLTIDERKSAARHLLLNQPDWSDRRIAGVCALSPRTVGRLRSSKSAATDATGCRVGPDGRSRLVQSDSIRLRILETVRTYPQASLRAIARAVGTSPETVRRVRDGLEQQERTSRSRALEPATPELGGVIAFKSPEQSIVESRSPAGADQAVTSASGGFQFATWFDGSDPGGDWQDHAVAVPLSRVYEIADEARSRSAAWREFAQLVEQRARVRRAI